MRFHACREYAITMGAITDVAPQEVEALEKAVNGNWRGLALAQTLGGVYKAPSRIMALYMDLVNKFESETGLCIELVAIDSEDAASEAIDGTIFADNCFWMLCSGHLVPTPEAKKFGIEKIGEVTWVTYG